MPSRRDMIRMTDSEVATFLGGRRTLNLASIDPRGDIHLVAMWYGFLDDSNRYRPEVGFGNGGEIVIETFAKSQKVQNFRRHPRFSALVEDGETYDQLVGVELVGAVSILEDPAEVVESCKAVLSRYQDFGSEDDLAAAAQFAANKRVCVKLHVERVVSWDHRKLDVAY